MQNILVIGSSNTDMVMSVDDIPAPGQTVMGRDFATFGGGKGANQAVAARRAGGSVCFISSVGNDDFGRTAIDSYEREGIDTKRIQVVDGTPSGIAMIFVSSHGENCIGVSPGANAELSAEFLAQNTAAFAEAEIILVQLEIPMGAVERAVELAKKHGAKVVLNPAPAAPLSDAILDGLYCITPNQTEAEALTGIRVVDTDSAELAANALRQRGVRNVIVTLGANGALLCSADGVHHQPAEEVDVVDTTAAGDTFNGILAAVLAEGRPLRDGMRLAVRGASLSATRPGAADSIPRRDEFDDRDSR